MNLWETLAWWRARYGEYPGYVYDVIALRCAVLAERARKEEPSR